MSFDRMVRRYASRFISGSIIVACVVSSPAASAVASPLPPADSIAMSASGIEWGMTYASKYLFQGGFDYSDGEPVVQPQATTGWNGLSLQVWSNWDQARREVNELDVTIQHDWQRGLASGAIGMAYLQYPRRDWVATWEVVGTVAFETFLEPTLDLHWDVGEGDGAYWTAGLSRELSVPNGSLSVATKLYGLEHYYGVSGITALEAAVSASGEWAGLSFEPSLQRQWTWENRDVVGENRTHPGWLLALTVTSHIGIGKR